MYSKSVLCTLPHFMKAKLNSSEEGKSLAIKHVAEDIRFGCV